MAETMGGGPEMDPKRTKMETNHSTNFEAKTPSSDISGQLENIRAMEGLEKAIENNKSLKLVELSQFYEELNSIGPKQRLFLKTLLSIGVNGDNLQSEEVKIKMPTILTYLTGQLETNNFSDTTPPTITPHLSWQSQAVEPQHMSFSEDTTPPTISAISDWKSLAQESKKIGFN